MSQFKYSARLLRSKLILVLFPLQILRAPMQAIARTVGHAASKEERKQIAVPCQDMLLLGNRVDCTESV